MDSDVQTYGSFHSDGEGYTPSSNTAMRDRAHAIDRDPTAGGLHGRAQRAAGALQRKCHIRGRDRPHAGASQRHFPAEAVHTRFEADG